MKFKPSFQLTVTILSLNLFSSFATHLLVPTHVIPPPLKKPVSRVLQDKTLQSIDTPTCTTRDVIRTKNGLQNEAKRWKSFHVYLDPKFEKWERDVISHGMWNLHQVIPCIYFGIYAPNQTPSGDYIWVRKGTNNGCSSYIGRKGGVQYMDLQSPGCINLRIVMHEMLHALGFYHEHSRYDRDDYVDILWDNIDPPRRHNFDKRTTSETTTFGVEYNHNSIMHYGGTAFSKNGQPTIVGKRGQHVGPREELQQTDIRKLKAMYKC